LRCRWRSLLELRHEARSSSTQPCPSAASRSSCASRLPEWMDLPVSLVAADALSTTLRATSFGRQNVSAMTRGQALDCKCRTSENLSEILAFGLRKGNIGISGPLVG
jgi:hypothetical protein